MPDRHIHIEPVEKWLKKDNDHITRLLTMQLFLAESGKGLVSVVYTKERRPCYWWVGDSNSGVNQRRFLDQYNVDIDISEAPTAWKLDNEPRENEGIQATEEEGREGYALGAYSSVWNLRPKVDSEILTGLGPPEHKIESRELIQRGYHPASVSCASINGRLKCASLWHRPILTFEDAKEHSTRKAKAAIAALRLGDPIQVAEFLEQTSDSESTSRFLELLAPLKVSLKDVETLLASAGSVRSRHLAILACGEYAGDRATKELSDSISGLYQTDRDAGVHSAAEWVIKQWSETESRAFPHLSPPSDPESNWYVNSESQTMRIIKGPIAYIMGSPPTESDRGNDEYPHQRRVNRSYAIGTKEVTVAEYEVFLNDCPQFADSEWAQYNRSTKAPVRYVSWLAACAYCRWLSEKESVLEDQMCVPKLNEIEIGMELPADYLQRVGYRLPTEAEWELACRAGSETQFSFGNSYDLLTRYACTKYNNDDDRPQCVGSVRPNAFGLFDMHGSVWEWCMEPTEKGADARRAEIWAADGLPIDDLEGQRKIDRESQLAVRGASFDHSDARLRSANRSTRGPNQPSRTVGFRIARTMKVALP